MIHIIDDDQNVRDGFMMLIESAGYECNCFESAEEFLKNYKAGENDLIILDMQLNEINGCILLEKLQEKGLFLPIIVITSFDEPKYRRCCKEYGVLAFLRKPVDGEALLDLIKYSLDIKIVPHKIISSQTKRSNI